MKHLPFNLAKAQAGHPLITRDGRGATYIRTREYPSSATLIDAQVDGKIYPFTIDGRFRIQGDSPMDLFLAVEEPQGEGGCCGGCPPGRPGEPGPTGPTGPPSLDEFKETYVQVPLTDLKAWLEMADCAISPGIIWKGSPQQAKNDAETRRLELLERLHEEIKTVIDRIS